MDRVDKVLITIGLLFLLLILSITAVVEYSSYKKMELGYEQTMVIGRHKPIWNKVR